MDSRKHYRQDGYQKGFWDAKRTGGKVRKSYIDNFFKDETACLSSENSLEFIEGWHEGFTDGVRGVLTSMVKDEGLIKSHIYELS